MCPTPRRSAGDAMRTLFHRINQALSGFCGTLMFIMMVLLVVDIVSRTFHQPIYGLAEMSVFVMMITIYLGMARCEENREHVRLELLLDKLPTRVRRPFESGVFAVELLTILVFFYAVLQDFIKAYQTDESVLGGTMEFYLWPVKVFAVVGLVFYLVELVFKNLQGFHGPGKTDQEVF
jgi:TRAP-type C4-dicarboxylate transport system permease small subunit